MLQAQKQTNIIEKSDKCFLAIAHKAMNELIKATFRIKYNELK